MELKWYKLIDVDFNLDKLLVWARKLQSSSSGNEIKTDSSLNGDLGSDQRYWAGEFPQKEFDYINSLIPLDGQFKGIQTSCSLWEYQTHTHLKPHIHEGGWLSGVIYLKVVPTLGNNEGSIEFALNSNDITSPKKMHEPKTGDIVLFPSNLHHRTIPFSTDADRIVIAFDFMPE